MNELIDFHPFSVEGERGGDGHSELEGEEEEKKKDVLCGCGWPDPEE